jgi:hypothetical protein
MYQYYWSSNTTCVVLDGHYTDTQYLTNTQRDPNDYNSSCLSVCLNVCLSVCPFAWSNSSPHWTYFQGSLYLRIFRKTVEKFKFYWNQARLTVPRSSHEDQYTFFIASPPVPLKMWYFKAKFVGKIVKHILCSITFFLCKIVPLLV